MTTSTQDPSTFTVDTLAEIERLNRRHGHHWFDADTKSFFSSRVHEPVIAHRFFISSERCGFDDYGRESTIRMVRNSGEIETVGDRLAEPRETFATPATARKALERARRPLDPDTYGRGALAEHGVSVRFDPYQSDWPNLQSAGGVISERGLDKRYTWRAYVGDLPIGSRTTKSEAREIAREAATACPLG